VRIPAAFPNDRYQNDWWSENDCTTHKPYVFNRLQLAALIFNYHMSWCVSLLAILGLAACVNPSPDQTDISSENTETAASTGANSDGWIVADDIGIAVKAVRLTAAGNVLDMRYKVTDIEKRPRC
jgi:hypothetical protein